MKLKTKYEKIVEQYLIAFVKKQDLDIDNSYWVADRVVEILSVNEQYSFYLMLILSLPILMETN